MVHTQAGTFYNRGRYSTVWHKHDDPFFDLLVGMESSGSLTPTILNWLEEGLPDEGRAEQQFENLYDSRIAICTCTLL